MKKKSNIIFLIGLKTQRNITRILISISDAARKCLNLGGQGYNRRNCKCKRKCRAAKELCAFKCHNSLSFKNK